MSRYTLAPRDRSGEAGRTEGSPSPSASLPNMDASHMPAPASLSTSHTPAPMLDPLPVTAPLPLQPPVKPLCMMYNNHLLTPSQLARMQDFADASLLQMTRLRDTMITFATCVDRDTLRDVDALCQRLQLGNISVHFINKHRTHLVPMYEAYCEVTPINTNMSLQSLHNASKQTLPPVPADNSLISAWSQRASSVVKPEGTGRTPALVTYTATPVSTISEIPALPDLSAGVKNESNNSPATGTDGKPNPLYMLAHSSPHRKNGILATAQPSAEDTQHSSDAVTRAALATSTSTDDANATDSDSERGVADLPALPSPTVTPGHTASPAATSSSPTSTEKTRHVKAIDNDTIISRVGELHVLMYSDPHSALTPVTMTIIHRITVGAPADYPLSADTGLIILREADEILVHKHKMDDHSKKAGFRQWLASRKIACYNATRSELQYTKLAQVVGWRSPNASMLQARIVVDVLESVGRAIDAASLEKALCEYDLQHAAQNARLVTDCIKSLVPPRGTNQAFAPRRPKTPKSADSTPKKKARKSAGNEAGATPNDAHASALPHTYSTSATSDLPPYQSTFSLIPPSAAAGTDSAPAQYYTQPPTHIPPTGMPMLPPIPKTTQHTLVGFDNRSQQHHTIQNNTATLTAK